MDDAKKYLTMENVRNENPDVKAFADKIVNSDYAGFIFLNKYLIENVEDKNRAPVAINLMIKMYKKDITLASLMDSTINGYLNSTNLVEFKAGCKLFYHLFMDFWNSEHNLNSQIYIAHGIDYGKILKKLVSIAENDTNNERKRIATDYLALISEKNNSERNK